MQMLADLRPNEEYIKNHIARRQVDQNISVMPVYSEHEVQISHSEESTECEYAMIPIFCKALIKVTSSEIVYSKESLMNIHSLRWC